MPRVNTNDAAPLIAELKPFTTNGSLAGNWSGSDYVVTSYGTAIAVISPEEQRVIMNSARYSVTTSRHQGEAREGVAALVARNGYDIENISTPAAFRSMTGHYASDRVI